MFSLWYLITGSKGGEKWARIMLELAKTPYNANKLSEKTRNPSHVHTFLIDSVLWGSTSKELK